MSSSVIHSCCGYAESNIIIGNRQRSSPLLIEFPFGPKQIQQMGTVQFFFLFIFTTRYFSLCIYIEIVRNNNDDDDDNYM